MSRWDLLRNSLRGKLPASEKQESSIHRFTGHNVVNGRKVLWQGFKLRMSVLNDVVELERVLAHFERIDCAEYVLVVDTVNQDSNIEELLGWLPDAISLQSLSERDTSSLLLRHRSYQPLFESCRFLQYHIQSLAGNLSIVVREQDQARKISTTELASNQHFGVDNTGNVCVWESESILLHTLLSTEEYLGMLRGKRVLEIGGGQTALCGLGIACAGIAVEVILSDGHPHCVRNQQVCVEMNVVSGSLASSQAVRTQLLQWANWPESSIQPGSMNVILGSDCLFFREFHDALLSMLIALLHPQGVIFLLQPPRSGTMQQFVDKAAAEFDIEQLTDYNEEVSFPIHLLHFMRHYLQQQFPQLSRRRDELLQLQRTEQLSPSAYNLDIHYPVLLLLRKKQPAAEYLQHSDSGS